MPAVKSDGSLGLTREAIAQLASIPGFPPGLLGEKEQLLALLASTPAPNVPKVNGVIRDFGGRGDGVSDDSAPILNTANACAGGSVGAAVSRGSGYFEPGIFIVTANAVLTPTNFTTLPGIHWQGAGWFTSVLRFGTLGGATWFYDNGASSRNAFDTFADLAFEGRGPAGYTGYAGLSANAKGFRLTSAGNEQGFKFFRCRFGYLDVDFDMEGTNTASEMKFFGCKFHDTRSTVYVLNNAQSFNHEFFGCDVETIYGDVFSVSAAGGGGAIKIYGGSWIMADPGTSTNTYFFRAFGGNGAMGNLPVTVNGVRFELRGNFSNLATIAQTSQWDLHFNDCLFEDQGTISKPNWLVVQAYATVVFRGCGFFELSGTPIQIVCGNVNLYGQSGTVTFDDCNLPPDWSDRCTVPQYSGAIRAINCHGSSVGVQAAGAHWAHDFDMHWNQSVAGQVAAWDGVGGTLRSDGSPHDNALRLKVAQIKLGVESWPTPQESTLKLPKNAIIKAIHLRKPAASGDVTVTTMRVGRNDKTGVDHLISNSVAMNAVHTGDVNDYYYHVGATVNERTLRLYSGVVTTGNVQGGICIVEYL